MQAIDTERSPGLPSLMVTTRRRLMPQGARLCLLRTGVAAASICGSGCVIGEFAWQLAK
jgi:hypothetical protein